LNTTGDFGNKAQSTTGINGPWDAGSNVRGAFRVEVSEAVPEPSTLGLEEIIATTIFSFRSKTKLNKSQIKPEIVRKARHALKRAEQQRNQ
jgi:hypothetical protein